MANKTFQFNDGANLYVNYGEGTDDYVFGDQNVTFWAEENTSEDNRYCDLTFKTYTNGGNTISVNKRVWQDGKPLPYYFDMSIITSENRNLGVEFWVQNSISSPTMVNIAWNLHGIAGHSPTTATNYWTNSTTEHNYNVTIGREDFGEHVFHANAHVNVAFIRAVNIQSDMPLINLAYCFHNCHSLTLDNFETNKLNVVSLSSTFQNCYNITNLTPLAFLDTSNLMYLSDTFNHCNNLTDISAIGNWDTSKVTRMAYMFEYCRQLTDISPLANFNTTSVIDMLRMFNYCDNLVNISAINAWSNAMSANCYEMFRYCNSLQGGVEIHFNITCAANMFANRSGETFNVYASTKTNAYNALYRAMGNRTNNSYWNVNLYEL